MKLITDKVQEFLSRNKRNSNIIHLVDNILADAAEAIIDENWCHIDNKLACNPLINGKYLSNIRDAPERQYIRVHCNEGVTYTNKIGDLPGYSNTVCYNPKGDRQHPVTNIVTEKPYIDL